MASVLGCRECFSPFSTGALFENKVYLIEMIDDLGIDFVAGPVSSLGWVRSLDVAPLSETVRCSWAWNSHLFLASEAIVKHRDMMCVQSFDKSCRLERRGWI